MRIYITEAIYYITFIVICEIYQRQNGQEPKKTFFDILYLSFSYFTGYSSPYEFIHFIIKLFIFVFVIFETISWRITHNGICPQVTLSILDYRYIIIRRPMFLVYGIIAFFIAIMICKIPGFSLSRKMMKIPTFPIITPIFFTTLTYHFYKNIIIRLNPYKLDYFIMPDNPKIISYFRERMVKVEKPLNKPLKNFIMLHIECAEQRSLGQYNRHFPNLMPFFQSLSKNGTILTNVTMMLDQSFTLSSVFTQRSGLPMLGYSYNNRGSLLMSKRVHTIMDFFEKLGYDQMASCTGFCPTYQFYNLHHMRSIDAIHHGQQHDYGHFKFLAEKLLPKLNKERNKWPFVLVIHNDDTHPEYFIEKECMDTFSDEMKKKWPKSLLALQCFDISLKRFFNKIVELGFDKNSEIFVYGDHLLWGDPWYYDRPRKLLMVLPFKKNQVIDKPISLFDVAPSILKLLGIENYSPQFPFGFDFFSPNTTIFPTKNDRNYINNIAHSIDSSK